MSLLRDKDTRSLSLTHTQYIQNIGCGSEKRTLKIKYYREMSDTLFMKLRTKNFGTIHR